MSNQSPARAGLTCLCLAFTAACDAPPPQQPKAQSGVYIDALKQAESARDAVERRAARDMQRIEEAGNQAQPRR